MKVYDAIMKRRSIRKFEQKKIDKSDLIKLIDCARYAAYGANTQPLKFMIIDDDKKCGDIFPFIKWAAYLSNGAPKENERPTAYIAILGDSLIKPAKSFETEAGAAVTTMMLEAVEMRLGSCWLGAIDRAKIKTALSIDDKFELVYLLALGYPAQESKPTQMTNGDVKYFLDENNIMNVPKRSLEEIIVE